MVEATQAVRKRRFSTTWVAWVLFLLLAGYWLHLRWSPSPPPPEPEKVLLYTLAGGAEELAEMEVWAGDELRYRLRRTEAGTWGLERPGALVRVNPDRVRLMATQGAAFRVDKMVASGGSLSPFGLDRPWLRLVFTTREGQRAEVLVGGRNPAGTGYYVMRPDSDEVYFCSDYRVDIFDCSPESLRDRSLVRMDLDQVTWFRLERADFVLEATNVDGGWRLLAPYRARGDEYGIRWWLNDLLNLRIGQFVDDAAEDLEPYGLNSPAVTIMLRLGEEELTLRFSPAPEGGYYAHTSREPAVYLVEGTGLSALEADAFELVAKRLAEFEPSEAEELVWEGPAGRFRCQRRGKYWYREDIRLATENVQTLLEKLAYLRGEKVADAPQAPQQQWYIRVRTGTGEVTLRVGRGSEGYWARPGDADVSFAVDRERIEEILRLLDEVAGEE